MTAGQTRQPYLRWSDRFAVGVDSLDEDHRALVDLINLACAAWEASNRDALQQALDRLLELAAAHFEREEDVLRHVAGHGALQAHASEHRNRLAQLRQILESANSAADGSAAAALPDALVDWFVKQSIGHDAAIKGYFDDGDRKYVLR